MNVPEEWVPTEAEVPADHWSKSKEWAEYKTKQAALEAQLPATKSTLPAHMQVGTVKQETRKKSTHEIQMEACRVEWVDPNPPAEISLESFAKEIASIELKDTRLTSEQLEEIARTIVEKVNASLSSDESDQVVERMTLAPPR